MHSYEALLVVLLAESIASYKILIFSPRLGYSHVNFMGRIADILVEAGHDVAVFVPDLNPDVSNNGSSLAKIIRKRFPNNQYFEKNSSKMIWKKKGDSILQVTRLYRRLADAQRMSCQKHLEDEKLMDSLRAEHYDLGVTEHISFCGYAIFKKIALKNYVTAMAINLMEVSSDHFGVSSNPSYVPASFSSKSDKMNYFDRLTNVIIYTITYGLTKIIWEPTAQSLQHHLPNEFDYIEVVKQSSLVFVNTEELLEFPRLVSRKVVFVGGIAVSEASPLTEDYQQLMDRSEHGVILVSFGTVVKSKDMDSDVKEIFEGAFQQLSEITFIWKYEIEKRDVYLSNVVKRNWVPQNDLLNHRNLLGFVSHCGQNSLMESINAGVPLICIPLYADQFRNSRAAESRNVALVLNKENLTANDLASALKTIIYDESYRKSAEKLKTMIRQKPMSARERLVKYTEFVIKYGPFDNFSVAGSELNIFQYFLVDVLIVIVPLVLLMIYISANLTLRLFFLFFSVSRILTRRLFSVEG
ncbi:unnamed protein product [Litomosoides sigmodontis]|uniref:UDP-glucuronosyltransferase n=1 Tax=Litomosoides sigmodontis TaxID=42156 RepID=A0A3P6SM41_LITSI|nr:unnamed protein product [Litomosoides sigmodontis]